MSQSVNPKYVSTADWDVAYREGTPPWDSGRPHAELARVLDEYRLRPQTVLEIGCGSGADAIALAKRRFEVTAVDCSPIAIERARLRAEQHDAVLRFVLDDIFGFAPLPASSTSSMTPASITAFARRIWIAISTCSGGLRGRVPTIFVWRGRRRRRLTTVRRR